MTHSDSRMRRLVGAILVLLGVGIAGTGIGLLNKTLKTGYLVATGYGFRNGGLSFEKDDLDATIGRLELASRPRPTADETAALAFLHLAGAEIAAKQRDTQSWIHELLAARAAARQTLALAPTRADVSLILAEVEFLLGGPSKAVDDPLTLSFVTAPRELWIIERRIGLVLRLIPTASPDMETHIEADIRTISQPFRDTRYYLELARAAFFAGPPSIVVVRRVLATVHEQSLGMFNADLAKMETDRARDYR